MFRSFLTRRTAGTATGLAVAGTAFAFALAPAGPADAAAGKTAAAAPALQIHALFSGGRTTGFRVGEPLAVQAHGKTLTKLCFSVAPLDHAKCGTRTSGLGPSVSGKLIVTATVKGGGKLERTLQIGAASTHLPASLDKADGNGGKVVVYDVTCDEPLYENYSNGKLQDETKAGLTTGTHVAGYYRAGEGVIQVYAYRSGRAGFVSDSCLKAAN